VGPLGLGPVVLAVVYVAGMLAIRERQTEAAQDVGVHVGRGMSLKAAWIGFVLAAIAIFAAGPTLARSADHLAESTGLGETFFGSFALALITTLPELAVSVTAIRAGALNLAIGNLFGSNATNMALLLPLEVAYGGDSILAAAGADLQTAASASILLMGIGVSSIVLRAERRRTPFDLAAVLMLAGYAFGVWAVYESRVI
jgi:cation:H+ antiporter